jgi:hypothetical protein
MFTRETKRPVKIVVNLASLSITSVSSMELESKRNEEKDESDTPPFGHCAEHVPYM